MIGMLAAAAAFIFMKINLKKQNSVLRTMQRERPERYVGWVESRQCPVAG